MITRLRWRAMLAAMATTLVALSGCAANAGAAGPQTATHVVTDAAGRSVEIPTTINSVYCAVPTAEPMVYSLAPDKLAAWVNAPSEAIKPILTEKARSLPVVGGWFGGKSTANMEQIIKLSPDVIVVMTDTALLAGSKELADTIGSKTGRPVLIMDSSLSKTAETYRTLGGWLGLAERGEKLAAYTEKTLASVAQMAAAIPEDEKVSVYYAESASGLATDPSGSQHTEVIDLVGGHNVADVKEQSSAGMTPVSLEQVAQWDPDVILVSPWSGGSDAYATITTDARWANLSAVKNHRVYLVPTTPFNWLDRPPSAARVIGVQWLGNLLYPDRLKLDITAQVKDFYSTFYSVQLTDDQVATVLKHATAG
jgi:iron complex transport system substrate-binding protein